MESFALCRASNRLYWEFRSVLRRSSDVRFLTIDIQEIAAAHLMQISASTNGRESERWRRGVEKIHRTETSALGRISSARAFFSRYSDCSGGGVLSRSKRNADTPATISPASVIKKSCQRLWLTAARTSAPVRTIHTPRIV